MKYKKSIRTLTYIILSFLTILAIYSKVTHGIDPDEEMAIVNMYRLSLNPRHSVFTLNWDPYQLVSTLFFPFIYIFKLNNYDYLVIGFRIITVIIQIFFVFYLSSFIKKYFNCSTYNTFCISCLLLLSFPKFIVSLDHSNPIAWFYTVFAVEMYKYIYPINNNDNDYIGYNKNNIHLYLSGFSYSLSVLAHPGNILVLPVVFVYLFKKRNYIDFLKFLSPCIISFIIFFWIFLKDNTLLFKNPAFFIKEILSEGSHKSSIINKISRRRLLIFITFIIISISSNLIKKHINLKIIKDFKIFDTLFILYGLSSIASAFLLKAPFAFQETFLFLLILLFFHNSKEPCFKYFFGWGLLILGILFVFSNMGVAEQTNYLLPFTFILLACHFNNDNYYFKNIIIFSISIFVLLIWIGYGCRVRTPYASTILDNRYTNNSVLAGIKTEIDDFNYYNLKFTNEKNINILTISDAPHLLVYPLYDANFIAPTSVSTPKYDQQYIDYINFINPDELYLIVDQNDTDYISKYDLFFSFLKSKYSFANIVKNDYYKVLFIKKQK